MPATAYRIELAKSSRAGCKRAECKQRKIKIDKHDLRFGTWIEHDDMQWFSWMHWGCVTPRMISEAKRSVDGDLDLLDGYEDLEDDLRAKIRDAFAAGHVADEDFRGDIEMNRPGKRGFHMTKAMREEKERVTKTEEEGSGYESPVKPVKKRDRVKKEDSTPENEVQATYKKRSHIKEEEVDERFQVASIPSKLKRVKKEEGVDDHGISPALEKARAGSKKVNRTVVDGNEDSRNGLEVEAIQKNNKAPRKKKKSGLNQDHSSQSRLVQNLDKNTSTEVEGVAPEFHSEPIAKKKIKGQTDVRAESKASELSDKSNSIAKRKPRQVAASAVEQGEEASINHQRTNLEPAEVPDDLVNQPLIGSQKGSQNSKPKRGHKSEATMDSTGIVPVVGLRRSLRHVKA